MRKLIFLILIFTASCAHQFQIEEVKKREPSSYQSCFQLMQKYFSELPIALTTPEILKAKSLNELEMAYQNFSLIDLQKEFSQEKILANNKLIQQLFRAPLSKNANKESTSYITKAEAEVILKEITHSRPNVNHMCYDPELKIGVCFGRATIGHMEALARGVHPDSILKIWIAGDMKEWGHHVAVMIKAEDDWWVLDTNLQRVVKTEEWIKFYQPMKNPDAKKDIMVFATRADRFGPYDSQSYSGINLFNSNNDLFNRDKDYYQGYFHDYFYDLDQKMPKIKKFPAR